VGKVGWAGLVVYTVESLLWRTASVRTNDLTIVTGASVKRVSRNERGSYQTRDPCEGEKEDPILNTVGRGVCN
jgi:hypothetical protein